MNWPHLFIGSKERDNSWGGAAVHELASPLYREQGKRTAGAVQQYMNWLHLFIGSKERDNSWGGAAVHELASPLYREQGKG